MGIFALKAMAKTHWAEKEERDYPKAWYKPVTEPEETDLAVRFTLSQPITAGCHTRGYTVIQKSQWKSQIDLNH